MAKVVQTQLLDEEVFGIDQSENQITAKQGNITTNDENDKITMKGENIKVGTIITGKGNDNVTIISAQDLYNGEEYTTLDLGSGDDTLSINACCDIWYTGIMMGAGDDKLTLTDDYLGDCFEEGYGIYLGSGDDTLTPKGSKLTLYLDASRIQGDDVLEQGKGKVYIDFSAFSSEYVQFLASGKDLVIKINGEFGPSTLTVKNHLALGSKSVFKEFAPPEGSDYPELGEYDAYLSTQNILSKIEGYKLLDNKITGTAYHDEIVTGIGNDVINAGKGDDVIISGDGNDTINAGTGINTIIVEDLIGTDVINSGNGYDVLKFTAVENIEDINFIKEDNNLMIHHADEGIIYLKNYYKLNGKHSVKEVVLADETSYNLAEYIGYRNYQPKAKEEYSDKKIENMYDDVKKHKKHIYGGESSETLTGSASSDFISTGDGSNLVKAGAGHDDIVMGYGDCWEYEEEGGEGYPEYEYPENVVGDDTVYAGAGDDYIYDDCYKIGDFEIYGEAGNDTIGVNCIGNHKLYGGAGNDFISCHGYGEDDGTATINAGTGKNDIQVEYKNVDIYSGGGTDNLIYWTEEGDYNFTKVGNDLVIDEMISVYEKIGNDLVIDGMISLKDYYKLNGKHSVKYINGIDITTLNLPIYDTIEGSNWVKNNLRGSVFSDSIVGGYSNDVIRGNNGHDIIRGEAGNDKLYGDAGNDIIWGEGGNDTIYGGTGFNEIRTGSGVDTVYCDKNASTTVYAGEGENKIYSSAGANTFVIENETSLTTIYNATANDTLDLSALDWGSLAYEINEKTKDLHISFGNTEVVLKNYFKAKDANFLNNIINSEGETITIDSVYKESGLNYLSLLDYGKVNVIGTMLSDYVETGDWADTIKGGYGNDTITSGAGNDKIYGGYGDDEISVGTDEYFYNNKYVDGGNGDDSIEVMGYGKHKIYGGTGDDNISINIGKATIYGGDGDDEIFAGETSEDCKIYGDKGDDYITAGSGNDYVDAGNGDDVIVATAEGNGKDTLYGGKGGDTYYLSASDFSGSLIYDASGYNDKIILENFSNNSNIIYFDLKIDKKGNIVESSSKNLYISNTDFMQYHKNGDAYHKVKDFFVKGHAIENIESSDGSYSATYENICFVREQVAQWLYNETSYKSIDAVIKAGGDDLIALQEILADCWQNVEQNY